MSILVNEQTKVICQGITGSAGAFHTRGCLEYGTRMVGGVTPGRGGTRDKNGLPIFDTCHQAVSATGAEATMIFVPASFAADAVMEELEGPIREGLFVNPRVLSTVDLQELVVLGVRSKEEADLVHVIDHRAVILIDGGEVVGARQEVDAVTVQT